MALKAFLEGMYCLFPLFPRLVSGKFVLPTGSARWLIDLIEVSPVIDRWFIQSRAKYFMKMPPIFHAVSKDDFPDGSV